MPSTTDAEAPLPFGVSASTGLPLNGLSDDAVRAMLGKEREPSTEARVLADRAAPEGVVFAMEGGIDENDLGQAGWGVIFAPGVDQKIKDALAPLLEHRKAQAKPFKIFDGAEGFLKGDTADDWLKRRNVRLDVVDPEKGVPFYLMIVGAADEIPFEFQYYLDIYWAVGRLWLETADEFRQYADSVIQYETAASVSTGRRAVMFATQHDFDPATQSFMSQVARPLADGEGGSPSVWARQKFDLKTCFGQNATAAALANILQGKEQGTPALLFSGSHGMEFAMDDPRQTDNQGAIVCQDWDGLGKITEEQWFAGSNLPADAQLHGMIHFFFACHGGGCPELDNYDRLNKEPRRIAQKPFFARLPQKLLSHPQGGALAELAHIERAWSYSFRGQRGSSQIQGFRDVIGRLLRGERIGQATDMFNMRWAAISADLADLHADLLRGVDVSMKALGNLWVARDDARNFMIFGDPAVRLRVEDMALRE
jgi:Peptidase family C25